MCVNRISVLLACLCCLSVPKIVSAQIVEVYDNIAQLEARILQAGETTLVVNFWATWCKPCVEELPLFEQLNERYAPFGVKVLLVSLDFKSQQEKRLLPFLRAHDLKCDVGLLADPDADAWIPRIDSLWDGAIPATLVVQGSKRGFRAKAFKDFKDLEMFILPFLRVCPRPARR